MTDHLARLGPIDCVTVTAPDLAAVESCYCCYLKYRSIDRGNVRDDLAELWQCPDMAGARFLLLAPEAGDDFVFRFIEANVDPAYVPFATHGWNAAELLVRDVDRLGDNLAASPFEIVGAPQDLSFSADIRAMQVIGPGRELLYLTEIKKPVPGLETPPTRCDVDRVFIVILGGPSMDALQDYYHDRFAVPRAPALQSRVRAMSAAFGNPTEHRYPIAALGLAGRSLIEVDEMPPQAEPRPVLAGRLPAGIAMVSFRGVDSGLHSTQFMNLDSPPYQGHRTVACEIGSAGERLEIITSA